MPTGIEPVDTALELVNGRNLPAGFPDDVVKRAVALTLEHRSVGQAYRVLRAELEAKKELAPGYMTVLGWYHDVEDVNRDSQGTRKSQMVEIATDVAAAYGERMLSVVDDLSPSQMPVAYGIAMQRRTDWESAGTKGNQMNVQFNFVRRSDTNDG